MMKKVIFLLVSVVLCIDVWSAREVKISVDQEDAKIYVDGSYFGQGTITAKIKKDSFIQVKIEKEGFVTIKTRINASAKQKAFGYTMHHDLFYDDSVLSGNANKFFTINISDDYVAKNGGEEEASVLVWKQLHQILLGYFDEIEKSDKLGGFIQTTWMYKNYPESNKTVRTRVSIQQTNIGGSLAYKIKISSEESSYMSSHTDDAFQPTTRVLKEYEPMIAEFQSRLGKI